jgi:hypothetical protein
MFSTDPVAMDRLLLDVIENKRKNEGALSMWDRSRENLSLQTRGDIRSNRFVREPGHIEFAAKLGLGEYEKKRIHVASIEI